MKNKICIPLWLCLYLSNHSPFSVFPAWRLKVAQQPSIAAGHTKGYCFLRGDLICGIHQEEIHLEQAPLHTWPLETVISGEAKANPDVPWDPVSQANKASVIISVTSNGKNHVSGLQVYV